MLLTAIRAAVQGQSTIDPAIAESVLEEMSHTPLPGLALTERESEVLRLMAAGYSNREIAEELCLTQRTVAAHVEAILTRLDTPTRAGAAAMATAAGILLPSPVPTSVRSIASILRRRAY